MDSNENNNNGNTIPPEIVQMIMDRAETEVKFNAALSCRRWMALLGSDLPQLVQLNIIFEPNACDAMILFKTVNDTSAALCQCRDHLGQQNIFLEEMIAVVGDRIASVSIDDCLANRNSNETVRDEAFSTLFSKINTDFLTQLMFCSFDFSSIRIWSLSLLAKCSSLRLITFDECRYPSDLTESFFVRIISPSFANLEEVNITGTALVTDKICMSLAKKANRLERVNLRGCSRITAFSVIAFCEALALRQKEESIAIPLTMDLRQTSFHQMELFRHLNNPLMQCGPDIWKPQSIVVNIGFDRNAVVIGNTQREDLIITVYV